MKRVDLDEHFIIRGKEYVVKKMNYKNTGLVQYKIVRVTID